MRQQKGQILISRGNWALRWRESVTDATGKVERKRCFRTLGPVLPEHKRNKKRIPKDVQDEADKILAPLNTGTTPSIRGTIGELVEDYFEKKIFKPSTKRAYQNVWKRYLENRIGGKAISSFKRVDAFQLWNQIHETNAHLSRATMNKVRFFVSGLFEFAKNIGLYIGENPATADLPEGLPGRGETQAYTVEEVGRLLLLLVANPLGQAIVSLAFSSGVRKGELAALRWEDYERTDGGAKIHVRRSVWQGHVTTPKTESSADVVFIGPEAVEYIEAYREHCGGVNEGYMFGYSAEKPIDLRSFSRWQIEPLVNRCGVCGKQVWAHKATGDGSDSPEGQRPHNGQPNGQQNAEHKYQRNAALPKWLGWSAFRRGNATHLAKQYSGDGVRAASLMLRHSNTAVTKTHYIKNTHQERRALEARKALETQEQREIAAEVIGSGLKQATIN